MRQWHVSTLESTAATGYAAPPLPAHGAVLGWNRTALDSLRAARSGATTRAVSPAAPAAHALALLHTAMYNAWAAYDDEARQTAHGVAVRLPCAERDAASKADAMHHAAYRLLSTLLPSERPRFDARMRAAGLDPAGAAGQFSPAGIGRTQAAAMLDAWRMEAAADRIDAHGDALLEEWCGLAAWVCARDRHDDDQDVLLLFALTRALADTARDGRALHDGAGAAAEVLRRFTGSDRLDAGALATFTAAAGVSVPVASLERGRQVGARVFDRARRCWLGKL